MSLTGIAGHDVDAQDLSLFQQNILLILAGRADGTDYGLGIKEDLEDLYGEEVNHGRLYPNLDELVDLGLLAKSRRDKRTNEYALTPAAREVLVDDAMRRSRIVEPFEDGVSGGDGA